MLDTKATEIFTINSSDGWNKITCTCLGVLRSGNQRVYRTSMAVIGKYWDREFATLSEEPQWNLIIDHNLELPQLLISDTTLDDIKVKFGKWLKDFEEFTTQCEFTDSQGIEFRVREREELISRKDRPVLTFKFKATRFSFETYFVVDPTCIESVGFQIGRFLT